MPSGTSGERERGETAGRYLDVEGGRPEAGDRRIVDLADFEAAFLEHFPPA
jgi:hypothetical protein